jgi:hypothetical protein
LLLPCIIIYFLHLLSTNHKCTQPCYFPLLLKLAAHKEKVDWNSLTRSFRLHVIQLPFLWSYGVFHCFVLFWVILVFRDIICVIIVLYSCYLVICEHFLSVCVEQLIPGIYTMSTWFWHKNRVWQKWYQSRVNHRSASLDRKVLSLVLFWIFAKIIYSILSPLFSDLQNLILMVISSCLVHFF